MTVARRTRGLGLAAAGALLALGWPLAGTASADSGLGPPLPTTSAPTASPTGTPTDTSTDTPTESPTTSPTESPTTSPTETASPDRGIGTAIFSSAPVTPAGSRGVDASSASAVPQADAVPTSVEAGESGADHGWTGSPLPLALVMAGLLLTGAAALTRGRSRSGSRG